MSIKLQPGSSVRINCPDSKKYPSFYRAFHGLKGRAVAIEPKGAYGIAVVDISDASKGEAGIWINVDLGWLSHAV